MYKRQGYNLTLYYGDIRVTLGPDTLLEEKITRVAAILPKISGKSGVLHLEDYSKDTVNIIFTEDVPEEDTDARDQEDSKGDESGDDSQSFGEDASGDGETDSGEDASGDEKTNSGEDASGDEETDSETDPSGTGETDSQNMETYGDDGGSGY